MKIAVYIGLTIESEALLQTAYLNVASRRERDAGIRDGCHRASRFTDIRLKAVRELGQKFGAVFSHNPKLLADALFNGPADALGLVRDLHDLSLLANQALLCWLGVSQACKALRDKSAVAACEESIEALQLEISRLKTEFKGAAPQVLTISDAPTQEVTTRLQPPPPATFSANVTPVLTAAAFTAVGLIGFFVGRCRSA